MSVLRAALPLTIVLLTAAGWARADDACLSGASTLGDQRAIATVRATLDATCPCDQATKRGKYRRCGKDVIAAALADATLRAACETNLKLLVKGAACGTTRVACGRVTPGKDPVVTCKVRGPKGCTDKPKYDQTACADQDFCADVVDWTAGTCVDVRERGPFEAGVHVTTFTKPSVVDPSQTRVLADTLIWYPIDPNTPGTPSTWGAFLDAPLDASGGPYPILMFSHGSCGYPGQSTFLLPLIASHGFVVVAPPHPGNTLFDGLGTCNSPQAIAASAQERPQDIIYVLDQMLAMNADPNSPFAGMIDPARIGMMGHSFGGFTTYRVVALDARFTIAVPLAPAAFAGAATGVPSLTMISSLDGFVNNDAVRAAYANSAAPKYLIEIENTGHFAYSDGCFPSSDCNPPVTLTQDEAHAAVRRWAVPFVLWKLGGDARFGAFFQTPRPAGVVYDAMP